MWSGVSIADLWVGTKYPADASNCLSINHLLIPSNVVFSPNTPLKSLSQKLSMIHIPSQPIIPTALEYPGSSFIPFLLLSLPFMGSFSSSNVTKCGHWSFFKVPSLTFFLCSEHLSPLFSAHYLPKWLR